MDEERRQAAESIRETRRLDASMQCIRMRAEILCMAYNQATCPWKPRTDKMHRVYRRYARWINRRIKQSRFIERGIIQEDDDGRYFLPQEPIYIGRIFHATN
jgi:hypothetical protein